MKISREGESTAIDKRVIKSRVFIFFLRQAYVMLLRRFIRNETRISIGNLSNSRTHGPLMEGFTVRRRLFNLQSLNKRAPSIDQ